MVRTLDSYRPRTVTKGLISHAPTGALILLGLLCAATFIAAGPLATNDGPIHVTFGNFLTLNADTHPQLFQQYEATESPSPNLGVYLLLALLLQVVNPGVAESIAQVLCTVGVVAAAWLALRQLGSDRTWLALLVFPLVFHRLFFLGMYSFCLSVAGFFLVLAAFLRLRTHPAWPTAILAAGALYLTFLTHAGGFVPAASAAALLVAAQVGHEILRRKSFPDAIRHEAPALLALAAPLPFVAWTLTSATDAPFDFGPGIAERVGDLLRLESLRVHGGRVQQITRLLGPMLCLGVAAFAYQLVFVPKVADSDRAREDALGTLAAWLGLVVLALIFPDTLGGGWIHFQRMALFPYFGAVLLLGHWRIPDASKLVFGSLAVATTVALLAETMVVQREIASQMQPLEDVSRVVGSHCSVLPVVLDSKPVDRSGRSRNMRYNPFLQSASRLELADDRVVLYNYQARSDVFPVHFRDGHDAQELIFHWEPLQQSTRIRTLDITRFEQVSGMPVDFILQWGTLDEAALDLRQSIQHAEANARPVYESPDRRVRLFRRATAGRSACQEPSFATTRSGTPR